MPLTERLERRGGLFLDSTSTLFFEGGRSGNGELPEDNSSSVATSLSPDKAGFLPLLCLTEGAGWLLPHAFSPRSYSRRAPQAIVLLLQMVSTVLQFSHLSGLFFLFRLHILTPAKELVFKGLICWVASHSDRI